MHSTGQVALTTNTPITGKFQIDDNAFVATKIMVDSNTITTTKFKLFFDPGNESYSDDFIAAFPYGTSNTTAMASGVGYERACRRPLFILPAGATVRAIFLGATGSYASLSLYGFYVNQNTGVRIKDGNIPDAVLSRLTRA